MEAVNFFFTSILGGAESILAVARAPFVFHGAVDILDTPAQGCRAPSTNSSWRGICCDLTTAFLGMQGASCTDGTWSDQCSVHLSSHARATTSPFLASVGGRDRRRVTQCIMTSGLPSHAEPDLNHICLDQRESGSDGLRIKQKTTANAIC